MGSFNWVDKVSFCVGDWGSWVVLIGGCKQDHDQDQVGFNVEL